MLRLIGLLDTLPMNRAVYGWERMGTGKEQREMIPNRLTKVASTWSISTRQILQKLLASVLTEIWLAKESVYLDPLQRGRMD